MTDPSSETIFARASGAGRAGVAVFRLSGSKALPIAERLCQTETLGEAETLAPRQAILRKLENPYTEEIIDHGLILAFPAPASFTGEDVVEFHLHGSAAVEAALYACLAACGARPAEAGEFTKRALLNGKLDLAQAEGLADLIDAETRSQARQALQQMDGRLSALADGWRAQLLSILAFLEADVDFPDEEDVPDAVSHRAAPVIDGLIDALSRQRARSHASRMIRDGAAIAIIGKPNAGKSSLLNQLAGAPAAIVSDIPGTTRDVIEVRLDLGGVAAMLADTAGLRDETADAVEQEGTARARARFETADIRLLVIDPFAEDLDVSRETSRGGEILGELREGDFIIWNKSDRDGFDEQAARAEAMLGPLPGGVRRIALSAATGEGVDELIAALTELVAQAAGGGDEGALTRARHIEAIDRALDGLARARQGLAVTPELAAEDVRLAARALGSITGAVDVEDVLGEIFSSFCIGK